MALRNFRLYNNTTAGELDPVLQARVGYQRYEAGVAKSLNTTHLPTGAFKSRFGTTHQHTVSTATPIVITHGLGANDYQIVASSATADSSANNLIDGNTTTILDGTPLVNNTQMADYDRATDKYEFLRLSITEEDFKPDTLEIHLNGFYYTNPDNWDIPATTKLLDTWWGLEVLALDEDEWDTWSDAEEPARRVIEESASDEDWFSLGAFPFNEYPEILRIFPVALGDVGDKTPESNLHLNVPYARIIDDLEEAEIFSTGVIRFVHRYDGTIQSQHHQETNPAVGLTFADATPVGLQPHLKELRLSYADTPSGSGTDLASRFRIERQTFNRLHEQFLLLYTDTFLKIFKLDDNGDLSLKFTRYTTKYSPILRTFQSLGRGDVVINVHESITPEQISRINDNTWAFEDFRFENKPYYEVNPSENITPTHSLGDGYILKQNGRFLELQTPDNNTNRLFLNPSTGNDLANIPVRGQRIDAELGITTNAGAFFKSIYQSTLFSGLGENSARVFPNAKPVSKGQHLIVNNGTFRFLSVDFGGDNDNVKVELICVISPYNMNDSSKIVIDQGFVEAFASDNGYPITVGYHQKRLWFWGSGQAPTGLWASHIGLIRDFDLRRGLVEDGIDDPPSTKTNTQAVKLYTGRDLILFAQESVIVVSATDGKIISPTDIDTDEVMAFGCAPDIPIVDIEGSVVFINFTKTSLSEIAYTFETESYGVKSDLLKDSGHLMKNPVDMAFKQTLGSIDPSVLYIVNEDGTMVTITIAASEQVLAPSLYQTDGTIKNARTIGKHTYIGVVRDTGYHIERITEDVYIDNSVTVARADQLYLPNLVTGREKVAIWSGNTYKGLANVLTGGTVDISHLAFDDSEVDVTCGLPYEWEVQTLPAILNSDLGAIDGAKQKIEGVYLRLYKTQGVQVNNIDVVFPTAQQFLFGTPLSDTLYVPLASKWESNTYLTVGADIARACTVLSVTAKMANQTE